MAFRFVTKRTVDLTSRITSTRRPLARIPYQLRTYSAFSAQQTSTSRATPPKRNVRLQNPQRLAATRHCSFKRNMCRHGEAAGAGTLNYPREQLPTNVVPRHYDLTLEPNFETLKFDGHVKIDFDVAEDSNTVSLNTLDIEVKHAALSLSAEGQQKSLSDPVITYDEPRQTHTFEFKDRLTKGAKGTLEIKFVGELNDKMAGFYRSYYPKPDGSKGILATSQMEPTDARRAFPCFDEPALKAEFTVTLVADKNLTCLSNMDVAEEKELPAGKKAVRFNKSPVMSTYLVAFIVGELNYIENNDFRVPLRVYAPPSEDIERGRYALEIGVKALEFYEKAFGLPYPLPKLDQVAIPDFAAGAMENWGLVTYRTVEVLFDDKTSGAAAKERVSTVITHEIAHQWFGNIVSPDWWHALWLNEGFAEFASRYSLNAFFPEWKLKESFVREDLQAALGLDGLRSSHPIEVPVHKAEEINEIFDSISYAKGSCVVHMISAFLGEDVFMEGVRKYLKRHAWGNATTNDLWQALSEASGKDVGSIMNIWTQNVGYPVVSVTETGNSISVEQHRFLTTGDVKPEEDKVLYPISLNVRTKGGVDKDLMLTTRDAKFEVADADFFKINADSTGFYRTKYGIDRLEKLGNAAELLSVQDRVGIVADTSALATSGYQKTSSCLGLFKALSNAGEAEYLVWDQILTRLGSIKMAWIEDEEVVDKLTEFQRNIVSGMAHKLGWKFSSADGHVEQQYKALMFGAAGMAGDEKVLAAAREMFEKFAAGDRTAIHPNIRSSAFSIVLKYGGEKEYDAVLKYYETAETSDERNSALRTLGQARDPKLRQRTLDMLLSGKIRDQDVYIPIGSLRSSKSGIEALFDWMQTRWDEIYTKFPAQSSMIGSIVSYCTSGLTKQEQLDQVDKFFAAKDKKGYVRALSQSTDSIKAKIAWTARDTEDLRKFLGI
ncbi:Aminopeptidase 2 [Colletotrichum fructicola]|uniref:Aminopeptidase n=2 Tax=Colletotrichum fructicola (strain Nara gc5) TaxID=1213859 RepID=A0A7J6JPI6_COLFN|nr:Aminopeptidase 2 [Colletotrichum fructicola]KAE9581094.1 Aminopeptidase 2 [Colletotrichum fructicola]KAF4428075.1 Aminopeptidase 2 [Colletotrichum fructicola]KAF4491937.1 Aminopeptidase 2 [Colletotrichum fructicola Nara gc5]